MTPNLILVQPLAVFPPAASLTSIGLTTTGAAQLRANHRKTIVVAPCLPALDRNLVELILAELFVDLADLPLAKGYAPNTNKPPDTPSQPANLVQTKNLMRDGT